jgi:DNA-binding transcriptional LysR family regulator
MKTPTLLDLVSLIPSNDLTRAASALGLTPAALMKRVESFESALGFKIVDRAAKALKPGEAGRLVIDHASADLFASTRPHPRSRGTCWAAGARICFGTDMLAAELPLGVALGRMATVNSRLRVHVETSADFEHLAREVLSGRLEFAIADTTSADASSHPAGDRAGRRAPRVLLHATVGTRSTGEGPQAGNGAGLSARLVAMPQRIAVPHRQSR